MRAAPLPPFGLSCVVVATTPAHLLCLLALLAAAACCPFQLSFPPLYFPPATTTIILLSLPFSTFFGRPPPLPHSSFLMYLLPSSRAEYRIAFPNTLTALSTWIKDPTNIALASTFFVEPSFLVQFDMAYRFTVALPTVPLAVRAGERGGEERGGDDSDGTAEEEEFLRPLLNLGSNDEGFCWTKLLLERQNIG